MMNTIFLPNIAIYLSIEIFITVVLYFLGHLLMTVFPSDTKSTALSRNSYAPFLVLTLIISTFAIVYTKGATVFWVPLVSFFLYLIAQRKHINYVPYSWSFKILFLFIGSGIILTLLLYYFFFVNSNGEVHRDFVCYTKFIAVLSNTHVEGLGAFLDIHSSVRPYHYFGFWFTLIVVKLFSVHTTYTLLLVIYPILFSILLVLGYNIACRFISNKSALIFSFLLLISTPLLKYTDFCSIFPYPKLCISYIVFAYLFLFYFEKRYTHIFLLIGSTAAIFTPISPTLILSGFFIYAFLNYRHTKSVSKALFNYKTMYLVSVGLFIVLFYSYHLLRFPHDLSESSGFSFNVMSSLKWLVIRGAKLSISLVAFLFLLKIKRVRNYVLLHFTLFCAIIFTVLISFLAVGIFIDVDINARQLFYNIAKPVLSILVFLILLFFYKTTRKKSLYIILASMVLLTNQYIFFSNSIYMVNHNRIEQEEIEFYKTIAGKIDSETKIGFIKNNVLFDEYREDFDNPLNKLIHCTETGNFDYYWLSVLDTDINQPIKNILKDKRKESQLYLYCNSRNLKFTDSNRLAFILDKKIEYIVVEKAATLPVYLQSYTTLVTEYRHNYFYRFTASGTN